MNSRVFELPLRVYIEDTDAGGIVYYVNYLKFMERARTEMLRDLGFGKAAMFDDNAMFVVRDVQIRYQAPASLDDYLRVESRVASLKRVTALVEQKVYRDEQLLVSGHVQIAAVNAKTMKPVAIPSQMFAAMQAAQ